MRKKKKRTRQPPETSIHMGEKVSKLMEKWTGRSRKPSEDRQDLLQDVAEKLLSSEARENFDGFASRVERNTYIDNLRRDKTKSQALDRLRKSSERNNSCYFPLSDLRLDLERAIRANFSKYEARVICDYFGADFTLDEISKKYRIRKRSSWHSWLKGAVVVLREALADYRNSKGEACP